MCVRASGFSVDFLSLFRILQFFLVQKYVEYLDNVKLLQYNLHDRIWQILTPMTRTLFFIATTMRKTTQTTGSDHKKDKHRYCTLCEISIELMLYRIIKYLLLFCKLSLSVHHGTKATQKTVDMGFNLIRD